ncbi:MAG: hypothetical protein HRU07_05850 [Nitrosopumilus sp.]|nr:hypothetical protein [Nitrosopumilus sp.]NRA05669.1 hypothetical protein [Nitrosopumilus sp.]
MKSIIVVAPTVAVFSILIFSSVLGINFTHAQSEIPNSDSNQTFTSFAEQVNQNYQSELWGLGDSLLNDSSYTYKICNDPQMFQEIYPYHCYTITLNFETLMESYNGDVWMVQGFFETPDKKSSMILQIDPVTFEVTSDGLHKNLGRSLENTIFSLSHYGKKSLSTGTQWDELDSYFTNKVSLEIKRQESIDTSFGTVDTMVLGYDVIVQSNQYINSDFPFPVKSDMFSPQIIFPEPKELFYYELLDYSQPDFESGVLYSSMCVNPFADTLPVESSAINDISNLGFDFFGWGNLK